MFKLLGQCVAQLDGANNIVSLFVYATHSNVPDYMIKAGINYRIITDQLGSPRLVVNVSTGQIAQQMEYDEFGNVLSDTNPGFQPFGFAGGLYEQITKLVRLGARDYDPETGRWTVKDPIKVRTNVTNIFGYASLDPVNLTDPSGLSQQEVDEAVAWLKQTHPELFEGNPNPVIRESSNMSPGDEGATDPETNAITIAENQYCQAARVNTIAHELLHAQETRLGKVLSNLEDLGAEISAAFGAAMRGKNPIDAADRAMGSTHGAISKKANDIEGEYMIQSRQISIQTIIP
jgi:RHS repeat-associated protein